MAQPVAVRQDSSPTGSVLVADDDPALLVLAQAALVPDGHTVVVARNGEEACRLFAEQVPDIVLLDASMPILSGYAACTRLRGSREGARTPILMLTGHADAESVARSYDVGATDFQAKPVDWRVLRERVKYMLKAKRDADELAQLAHYDSLTGLPNRATFRGHLKRGLLLAEERRRLLAVLFLDLDGFKEINDTFGHGFGDQILALAAKRLAHGLRAGDTLGSPDPTVIAGRFGGDEFTVCVSDLADVEGAEAVADRVRAVLASPFHVEGREVFVTASTGVSVYPFDGTDAETLLKHADAAMYEAKALGRNNHAPYRAAMSAKASERLSLAGELRGAVDREEFRVHYQPKVEIQTGRMVGAEALIRWQHPERGLLAPAEFMGLAEELGLGLEIGDWLLRTSLANCKRQSERGDRLLPIALNVSNSQFRVCGFLDRITQAITTSGLEPSCLELEITEDVVVHNRLAARELLAKFKALGIATAIDDFGTGQSALSTLRGLPADALKIDQSFVHDLDGSESDRAITASIIDIGHHLGMTVIAEGVETQEQLDLLGMMGCDQAQGFFFSQALPAEEFKRFPTETGVRTTGGERTPTGARGPWGCDEGDVLTARWDDKTVIDRAAAVSCRPDEWLLVEAWDES